MESVAVCVHVNLMSKVEDAIVVKEDILPFMKIMLRDVLNVFVMESLINAKQRI